MLQSRLLLLHCEVSWGSGSLHLHTSSARMQLECIHGMPIAVHRLFYVGTMVHGTRVVTKGGLCANHHMQICHNEISSPSQKAWN